MLQLGTYGFEPDRMKRREWRGLAELTEHRIECPDAATGGSGIRPHELFRAPYIWSRRSGRRIAAHSRISTSRRAHSSASRNAPASTGSGAANSVVVGRCARGAGAPDGGEGRAKGSKEDPEAACEQAAPRLA